MLNRSSQRVVGLDVGQTSTKMVILERAGADVKLVKAAVLDNRAEGILSDSELADHLGPWLKEQGYRGSDVILNLPQFMSVTQVSDFPPGAAGQLEEMVRFETQQLAGLSDEAFIQGFRRLTPSDGFRNPVLIGICRESMVRLRLGAFENVPMVMTDLVMEGEALAAAFSALHAREAAQDERILLLDIGAENTTCVVLQYGQVVYTGSLMTGGDFFSEAIARHLGLPEAEALRTKMESRINPADLASPLTRTARSMANELETALENWWQQLHGDDASALQLTKIYVCGGGANLGGLPEFLHETFKSPVHHFNLPGVDNAVQASRLPIAYGLAVQALRSSKGMNAISFAPASLKWEVKRKKRVPVLWATVVVFAAMLAVQTVATLAAMRTERVFLENQRKNLEECRALAPMIKTEETQIENLRRMLRPFAAMGNRNTVFVKAIEQISKYKNQEDWFVMLADQESFEGRALIAPVLTTRPSAAPSFAPGSGAPATASGPAQVTLTSTFNPWRSLYVSGFTRQRQSDQLATVVKMIGVLNGDEESLFRNVDILSSEQISPLNYQLRQPWLEYFRMRPFTLRLPLKTTEFEAEVAVQK